MCVTCRLGLHLSGKLAADAVIVGADVVKTPTGELLGAVELPTYKSVSVISVFVDSFCFAVFFGNNII